MKDLLRQAVFDAVMNFMHLDEENMDDQEYATEFTAAIVPVVLPAYLRGRHDERASILGWLQAEAEDESLPSYANAYRMMATALSHVAPELEMHGLGIRRIQNQQ